MTNTFAAYTKPLVYWLNRLSGWLLLLAIIWLCWGIARIVWLAVAPPQPPNLPVASLQAKNTPMFDASAALAVFETPKPQTPQVQPPPNVILAGVMIATPSYLSSAMMSVNGVMQNYRVGDQLAGTEYQLIDVAWDQAVIADSNDREIVIKMPERMALDQSNLNGNNNGAAGGTASAPNQTSPPFANGSSGLNSNVTDATAEPTREEAQQDSDQERLSTPLASDNPVAAIDNAVSKLKENPASYLSNMGVMATGEGYQVTGSMPDKLRRRLGLEPGDKVLSVNGQAVGSNPASDADLLNQVKQSGQATIEVQRGDQVLTVRQQF